MSNVAREAAPVTASFICFFFLFCSNNRSVNTYITWSSQRHGKPSMYLTLGNVYWYKFLLVFTMFIGTNSWITTIPSSFISLKVTLLLAQSICKVRRKITERVRFQSVDKIQLLVAVRLFNISMIKNFSIIKTTFKLKWDT